MNQLPHVGNLDGSAVKKGSTPDNPETLPSFLPKKNTAADLSNFRVRYQKLDLDSLGDIAELERLETLAIQGKGITIWSKRHFEFMDKMYVLVQYLEETL